MAPRLLFNIFIFLAGLASPCSALEFNAATDCQQKAETIIFLASKSFDPIPPDDCRVTYYKQACEHLKKQVQEQIRTAPQSSHASIQRRAVSYWTNLSSLAAPDSYAVCGRKKKKNMPDEFDFGEFDF
nr:hypothetical protein [uncultured Desulfobulbus sp.]